MQQTDRITSIIRALLAKSTANGATEAEAIAAAEKARELMDRYNVTADVEAAAEDGAIMAKARRYGRGDRIAGLVMAVAEYCDCKAWVSRSENAPTFCGAPADADMAVWLFESLHAARDRGLIQWRSSPAYQDAIAATGESGRLLGANFTSGFVARVAARLRESKAKSREAAASPNAQSLVVVKDAAISNAMQKAGIRFRAVTSCYTRSRSEAARDAGRAAGDRASFGRPLDAGG